MQRDAEPSSFSPDSAVGRANGRSDSDVHPPNGRGDSTAHPSNGRGDSTLRPSNGRASATVPRANGRADGDGDDSSDIGTHQRENGHDRAREAGTVYWFSAQKGYGFIRPDRGGEDVFVRYSSIHGDGFRALTEKQRVTFRRGDDDHGPQAMDVEAVKASTDPGQPAGDRANTVPSSVVR